MHILVTGGFGFIGSHLSEALLERHEEARVHVVDNLSTSALKPEEFLARLGSSMRFSYAISDVNDYFAGSDLPDFDEIYHLASVVGPVGVLDHGGDIIRSVVRDTYAVADYALTRGTKLCDISTSEVYGPGRDGYCSERSMKIVPPKVSVRLEYAIGKMASEVALINMAEVQGLHATIVRPFNVAGPRQSAEGGFVLPRFINQALKGRSLTVYGDGTAVRAFTHVRDVCDGIIRTQRRGHPGEAYNIGNPANKTTIRDLATMVLECVHSEAGIVHVDPQELWGPLFEEGNDKYPDARKATEELGWEPQYDLKEIIVETAQHIEESDLAVKR